MMDDLLTTKQVQDILKVDRITVYRMLNDGRLKGVKIGQQWRFPAREVERLLSGEAVAVLETQEMLTSNAFPTHCIQSIQDLFSGMSGLSAVTLDLEGNPISAVSAACPVCMAALENADGLCQTSWQQMAEAASRSGGYYRCQRGNEYLFIPVFEAGSQVAWLAVVEEVGEASSEALANSSREQRSAWARQAAATIEGILNERSSLMKRLQRIAELTQLS